MDDHRSSFAPSIISRLSRISPAQKRFGFQAPLDAKRWSFSLTPPATPSVNRWSFESFVDNGPKLGSRFSIDSDDSMTSSWDCPSESLNRDSFNFFGSTSDADEDDTSSQRSSGEWEDWESRASFYSCASSLERSRESRKSCISLVLSPSMSSTPSKREDRMPVGLGLLPMACVSGECGCESCVALSDARKQDRYNVLQHATCVKCMHQLNFF